MVTSVSIPDWLSTKNTFIKIDEELTRTDLNHRLQPEERVLIEACRSEINLVITTDERALQIVETLKKLKTDIQRRPVL